VNLYCSEFYQRTDPKLIEVLASVISKMYHARRTNVTNFNSTIRDESRKYGEINVNDNTFKWNALPSTIKLSYEQLTIKTRLYFLIQDYHGGADGRLKQEDSIKQED
jgi:hypothetical protein